VCEGVFFVRDLQIYLLGTKIVLVEMDQRVGCRGYGHSPILKTFNFVFLFLSQNLYV
jgi:hypothetical protein